MANTFYTKIVICYIRIRSLLCKVSYLCKMVSYLWKIVPYLRDIFQFRNITFIFNYTLLDIQISLQFYQQYKA